MTYFATAFGDHATVSKVPALPGFERAMRFVSDDPDRCFSPRLGARTHRAEFAPLRLVVCDREAERVEEDPERWDGLS